MISDEGKELKGRECAACGYVWWGDVEDCPRCSGHVEDDEFPNNGDEGFDDEFFEDDDCDEEYDHIDDADYQDGEP